MQTADRLIALSIIGMSLYFMSHAVVLPIGWNGETGGPGGGAFPFWLSLIMALAAGGVLIRSFLQEKTQQAFFDHVTLRSVISVGAAVAITIALMPYAGSYIAIPLFMFWYLKIYGRHGWGLTLILTLSMPVFLFFFFEVTLKILLPKGWTEAWFIPLYAAFF